MKRVVLIVVSLIYSSTLANQNFKQKHLPGVTKGLFQLVGTWHIEMNGSDKVMDWFLYRQTVTTPQGKKFSYKLIMISQDWGRLNPSKPMDVAVREIYRKVNPPIHELIIRLENVLELHVNTQEGRFLDGTLYELRRNKQRVIGHVRTAEPVVNAQVHQ